MLKYAGALQRDRAVVQAAVASNKEALQFASRDVLRDPEFRAHILTALTDLHWVFRGFFLAALAQQGVRLHDSVGRRSAGEVRELVNFVVEAFESDEKLAYLFAGRKPPWATFQAAVGEEAARVSELRKESVRGNCARKRRA